MDYVKLAKVADFENRRIKSYKLLAKAVAIVKEADGSFYATEIGCKHNNADLTTGRFRGDIVTCPRHGWEYNIRTGECLNQNSARLRKHGLKVEGDTILVSLRPIDS
jgi:nitrite reductase/ring-hydroxylating ferredoxin subunit